MPPRRGRQTKRQRSVEILTEIPSSQDFTIPSLNPTIKFLLELKEHYLREWDAINRQTSAIDTFSEIADFIHQHRSRTTPLEGHVERPFKDASLRRLLAIQEKHQGTMSLIACTYHDFLTDITKHIDEEMRHIRRELYRDLSPEQPQPTEPNDSRAPSTVRESSPAPVNPEMEKENAPPPESVPVPSEQPTFQDIFGSALGELSHGME